MTRSWTNEYNNGIQHTCLDCGAHRLDQYAWDTSKIPCSYAYGARWEILPPHPAVTEPPEWLVEERDMLYDQLDIMGDLFGEITDLVRGAGFPETMATFRAVQALIAELERLRAASATWRQMFSELGAKIETARANHDELEAKLREVVEERRQLWRKLSEMRNERDDLRAQLSAKEAK